MIKKILFGLVAILLLLVAVAAVASFMSPTDFRVEREVTINQLKTQVIASVKMLKNGSDWVCGQNVDPGMKTEYRGTDGTVGFVSNWNGINDDIGEGEQEIKRIVEGERLDTELRFKKPFESKADAYITTDAAGNSQTKVKRGFTGSMLRPMNLMLMAMDMDKEVGKDFQEGLTNLKAILEN